MSTANLDFILHPLISPFSHTFLRLRWAADRLELIWTQELELSLVFEGMHFSDYRGSQIFLRLRLWTQELKVSSVFEGMHFSDHHGSWTFLRMRRAAYKLELYGHRDSTYVWFFEGMQFSNYRGSRAFLCLRRATYKLELYGHRDSNLVWFSRGCISRTITLCLLNAQIMFIFLLIFSVDSK